MSIIEQLMHSTMPELIIALLPIKELHGRSKPINADTAAQKGNTRTAICPNSPYDMAGKEFLMLPLKCVSKGYTGEVTIIKAKAMLLEQTKLTFEKEKNEIVGEYIKANPNTREEKPWTMIIMQPPVPFNFKEKYYVVIGPINGDIKEIILK